MKNLTQMFDDVAEQEGRSPPSKVRKKKKENDGGNAMEESPEGERQAVPTVTAALLRKVMENTATGITSAFAEELERVETRVEELVLVSVKSWMLVLVESSMVLLLLVPVPV